MPKQTERWHTHYSCTMATLYCSYILKIISARSSELDFFGERCGQWVSSFTPPLQFFFGARVFLNWCTAIQKKRRYVRSCANNIGKFCYMYLDFYLTSFKYVYMYKWRHANFVLFLKKLFSFLIIIMYTCCYTFENEMM